jgi:hypothetical protein
VPKRKRALTAGELEQAQGIYGGRINYRTVEIHEGKYAFWQPSRTAMAPNGNVYFPPPIYRPDFSIDPDAMSFLIHELAHVWQIQSGVWLKMRRVFLDGGVYDYGAIDAGATLGRYKVEQQASIIADYYRLLRGLQPQHGSGPVASYAAVVHRAMEG